jgi:hypothetical protein
VRKIGYLLYNLEKGRCGYLRNKWEQTESIKPLNLVRAARYVGCSCAVLFQVIVQF